MDSHAVKCIGPDVSVCFPENNLCSQEILCMDLSEFPQKVIPKLGVNFKRFLTEKQSIWFHFFVWAEKEKLS